MNSIAKIKFPRHSILFPTEHHYADSYSTTIVDQDDSITPLVVGKAFFSMAPKWLGKLLEFRNWLVSFIGLKTVSMKDNRKELLNNFKAEKGEGFGLFKVIDKTENELILGEDDSHLDFRISLLVDKKDSIQKEITITTTVIFNNWIGRVYFLFVKPFHQLIVPKMLKSIINGLEKNISK